MSTEANAAQQSTEVITFPLTPKPGELYVMRRDNVSLVPFNHDKIKIAITSAYLAVEGDQAADSRRVHEVVEELTEQVSKAISRYLHTGGIVRVEEIQDQVELAMMRSGLHKVARTYILYREERRLAREAQHKLPVTPGSHHVTLNNGQRAPLDEIQLKQWITRACQGLPDVDAQAILEETKRNIFDGIKVSDLRKALIMSARTKIELEPQYSFVAARLLLDDLHYEALTFLALPPAETEQEKATIYPQAFRQFIQKGIELELLSRNYANTISIL